jgi:hypothetical protein
MPQADVFANPFNGGIQRVPIGCAMPPRFLGLIANRAKRHDVKSVRPPDA